MRRRILLLTSIASLSTLLLFILFQASSWNAVPRETGLGEADNTGREQTDGKTGPSQDLFPERKGAARPGYAVEAAGGQWSGDGTFREPKVEALSPYPEGKTKSPGSNYTKTLVMPKMMDEEIYWVGTELGDLVESGLLSTAIYHMDDKTQPLHPIKNKGNEAMAYLTYIIDAYDGKLADVTLFMHSHRFAKHNNDLLDRDAALMIRHLSPEKVTRDGYMNLRCHWAPGCPDWLHPGAAEYDEIKPEEYYLAQSWAELFPLQPIPTVLSQPCCAQFAVSKERILTLPKSRYIFLRDWLLRTELSNYLSGRIFEYTWQYLFAGTPVHCPSMSVCYCDGYGVCFRDAEQFDYYFELLYLYQKAERGLKWWGKLAERLEAVRKQEGGSLDGDEVLVVPEVGRDEELAQEMVKLSEQMRVMVKDARERGRDHRVRAMVADRGFAGGDVF